MSAPERSLDERYEPARRYLEGLGIEVPTAEDAAAFARLHHELERHGWTWHYAAGEAEASKLYPSSVHHAIRVFDAATATRAMTILLALAVEHDGVRQRSPF